MAYVVEGAGRLGAGRHRGGGGIRGGGGGWRSPRTLRPWVLTGEASPHLKPGILRLIRGADPWLLLGGLACVLATLPGQGLRWLWLLRTAGLRVSLVRAMRLTMVGQFFNVCMPGTTGGDFMKAYYAARNSGQREAAVMSVVMDRLLGLIGLVVMAAVVGLFTLHDPTSRGVTLGVWGRPGPPRCCSPAGISTPGLRATGSGWGRLLGRLPFRESLTPPPPRATAAYGRHPWVLLGNIGFSIVMHALFIAALVLAGRALGGDHAELCWCWRRLLPLVLLIGSMPVSLLGLGVMEAVAIPLLVGVGHASVNGVLGMLMMLRIYLVAASLLGAIWGGPGAIRALPECREPRRRGGRRGAQRSKFIILLPPRPSSSSASLWFHLLFATLPP